MFFRFISKANLEHIFHNVLLNLLDHSREHIVAFPLEFHQRIFVGQGDDSVALQIVRRDRAIVLEAIVKETEREDMIYTNKEKFNHLAKKHPALGELQKKLGLDPDY